MALRLASLRPLAAVAVAAWTQPEAPGFPGRKGLVPAEVKSRYSYLACKGLKRPDQAQVIDLKFDRLIKLVNDVPGKNEDIRSALQIAKQDFEKPIMIMFVGAFSAGKSALINSILNKKVCATGIRPTTSEIQEFQWDGMLLVDSAGLDAMNKPEHKEKALEAARRSNVAVVVLNARQPLRESEKPILREVLQANSKVVVAINYWNHVQKKEEREECMKCVEEILADLMPGKRPPLFYVDASSSGDKGVKQLRKHLQSDDLQDGSQKVISATTAMLQGAKRIVQLHQDRHEALQKELEETNRTLQSINKSIEEKEDLLKSKNPRGGFWASVAKGAAAGSAVDFASGGLSCGIGTIGGALAGACLARPEEDPEVSRIKKKIKDLEEQKRP